MWLVLLSAVSVALCYDLPFRSISEKDVGGYRPTESTSFVIPSNQCSGFIDQSIICGGGGVAGAIQVKVLESMSFPSVRIDRHLRNVSIIRAVDARGSCATRALVELRVGCMVAAPRAAQRRRRAILALPPLSPGNGL